MMGVLIQLVYRILEGFLGPAEVIPGDISEQVSGAGGAVVESDLAVGSHGNYNEVRHDLSGAEVHI